MKMSPNDFRQLKTGMFIHYNMATYKNVQWVEGNPSPADFDPGVDRIDTDQWAETANAAGMRYAVLTTKHVAGFCLWDSKLTDYTVMHPDCPYQHDLVAQFVESFTSRGMKVGFYYLWRNPGFGDVNKYKAMPPNCDPADKSLEELNAFQMAQIRELVEMFPDCFYIWNDGLDPDVMPAEEARAFFDSLPTPVIVNNNWWDWGLKGTPYLDIAVKEKRHFDEDNTHLGETCWTTEDGWFWEAGTQTADAQALISHMETALGRHSNFLLNVGPDRQGRILPQSIAALEQIGDWWASSPLAR